MGPAEEEKEDAADWKDGKISIKNFNREWTRIKKRVYGFVPILDKNASKTKILDSSS